MLIVTWTVRHHTLPASRSATQSHRAIYGMRYTLNLLSAPRDEQFNTHHTLPASRSATQSYLLSAYCDMDS